MTAASAAGSRLRFGAVLVLAAGLCWSTTGTFFRFAAHLDSWQFLFWRSLGVSLAFVALAVVTRGPAPWRGFAQLGLFGYVVAAAIATSAATFIVALKSTTVADALFLASVSPLLSAVLGYFVLGERLTLVQAVALALGMVGLSVIVGGAFEAGGLFGNVCALVSALTFAIAGLVMRAARGRDFSGAFFACGLIAASFGAVGCWGNGASLMPNSPECAVAFTNGFLAMGFGFFLFNRGAPATPAVGQTVLAQTETIFGPLWVWLIFSETPGTATIVGGAVVLAAVVIMAFAGAPERHVLLSDEAGEDGRRADGRGLLPSAEVD